MEWWGIQIAPVTAPTNYARGIMYAGKCQGGPLNRRSVGSPTTEFRVATSDYARISKLAAKGLDPKRPIKYSTALYVWTGEYWKYVGKVKD